MIFTPNKIVLHHSVTPRDLELSKSVRSFDVNHKTRIGSHQSKLGWYVTYHFVIAGDGSHMQCRDIDEIGWHASNMQVNNTSIGICLTGNFDEEHPTSMQLEKLAKIVKYLESELGELEVHFHNEYAKKTCPGKNITQDLINGALTLPENEDFYFSKLYKDVFEGKNRTFKFPRLAIEKLNKISQTQGTDALIRELVCLVAVLLTKQDIEYDKEVAGSDNIVVHDILDSCDCNKA